MAIKILRIVCVVIFFLPNLLITAVYSAARFLLTHYVALEIELFRDWGDTEWVLKTARTYCEGFSITKKEANTINSSAGCEAITVNFTDKTIED